MRLHFRKFGDFKLSLPLLQGPLYPGVSGPVSFLSMGQYEYVFKTNSYLIGSLAKTLKKTIF